MTIRTVTKPLARLADHLLPDGLEAFLTNGRAEGLSWDRLARRMFVATNGEIDTNGATVRLWGRDIGIEKAEGSAA